jgi:hypothetical protein
MHRAPGLLCGRCRGQPVGVVEAEGLSPVLDGRAFDESAVGFALVCGESLLVGAARARLSSMSRMVSHGSLMTASSPGEVPRFLMILRTGGGTPGNGMDRSQAFSHAATVAGHLRPRVEPANVCHQQRTWPHQALPECHHPARQEDDRRRTWDSSLWSSVPSGTS